MLIQPILFSQRFNVAPIAFDQEGFLEPILNSDTKLFIDPLLLSSSSNFRIREEAYPRLISSFREVVRLLDASRKYGDPAWKAAAVRLSLSERPETGLGYGGSSTSGSSRPESLKDTILKTAKEILEIGEKDPEIISLMGLFDEGVGPDTISDITTNIIAPVLCALTEEFSEKYGIAVKQFTSPIFGTRQLPENPFRPGSPIILVPRDILRELPLAASWSDVSRVVSEVAEIRDAFNGIVGNITQSEKKQILKEAALRSHNSFKRIFDAVRGASDSYDPNIDALNFYSLRKIISSDLTPYKGIIPKPSLKSGEELLKTVMLIVDQFRYLVENNNLWELLWHDGKPKRERASQLLFFAIADAFCRANDLDISPETHAGGGPVDFKFSTGYHGRVLVELKRSNGQVVHGYEKQLEVYKTASRTEFGIFLIVDVSDDWHPKLTTINTMRREALKRGEKASEIVVINAHPRPSASKAI